MRALRKIMLAVDLDQPVRKTEQVCCVLSERFDTEVVPIHVIDESQEAIPESRLDDVGRSASERLQQVVDRLKKQGATVGEPVVAFGRPYEMLLVHAEDQHVNAIVVGAGGRPDVQEVGPTTETLVRRSPLPIWVVNAASPAEPKIILCPIDFSPASERALRDAVHVARAMEGRLRILHAVNTRTRWFTPEARTAGTPEERKQQAKQKIDALLRRIDCSGVSVEVEIRTGSPSKEILSAASECGAELLVMGSAGRLGIERLFIGSVASGVLRRLPCSVVTVKTEHTIRAEGDETIRDFETHFEQGIELGSKGFSSEALSEFRKCLQLSPVSPQVWQAMGAVYERLGDEQQARSCRERADAIAETIENQRIQAEIRSGHWLWKGKS